MLSHSEIKLGNTYTLGNVEKHVLICHHDIIKFYYKNDFGIVGKTYFCTFLFFRGLF